MFTGVIDQSMLPTRLEVEAAREADNGVVMTTASDFGDGLLWLGFVRCHGNALAAIREVIVENYLPSPDGLRSMAERRLTN